MPNEYFRIFDGFRDRGAIGNVASEYLSKMTGLALYSWAFRVNAASIWCLDFEVLLHCFLAEIDGGRVVFVGGSIAKARLESGQPCCIGVLAL